MISRQLFLFLLIIAFPFCSCKDSKRYNEALKFISEWMGKEILFPEGVKCFYPARKEMRSDICNDLFEKEFKIMVYVDSAGCSSCRLKLFEWQQLIEEADSLFHGKVGFLLYFQPKNIKEIEYLFSLDRFEHPVFVDISNTINKLNHFPSLMEYQCFLLDRDNKVLIIGNPSLNRKIWELYKSQIGEKSTEKVILTTIEIDKTVHDYGTISKGSSNHAVFTIKNTGDSPLIIYHISTPCGCTNVEWDKRPIEPGKTVSIYVEMKPGESGYFDRKIEVYCNISKSSIKLTINGNAYE